MAPTSNVEDLAQQAPLIFEGTIVSIGTSTMATFAATGDTAVVRVDEIVRAPNVLRSQAGREITIQLRPKVKTSAGDQALFFAEGLMYGRKPLTKATNGARSRVDTVMAAQPDARLRTRVASAALVVTGRVAATAPIAPDVRLPISEHDPEWRRATVDIEGVEKGGHDASSVQVTFASSRDVAWYEAPKLREGDRGVFLLHRSEAVSAVGAAARDLTANDFVVLDPLDFQPVNQRDRIQALARP